MKSEILPEALQTRFYKEESDFADFRTYLFNNVRNRLV
ncbi:hypothetical protein FORC31_p409 (plasmid) [Escherichia coli]|nr:hypothetical protein FORC31_p409 [Escherichia coli]